MKDHQSHDVLLMCVRCVNTLDKLEDFWFILIKMEKKSEDLRFQKTFKVSRKKIVYLLLKLYILTSDLKCEVNKYNTMSKKVKWWEFLAFRYVFIDFVVPNKVLN